MKKLLIPVDFSDTSDAAVDFGLQLAEKCGYHVMLFHSVDFMHTYESMYMDAPHVQSFTQQVVKDMEVELDNLLRRCSRDNLSISKHLTTGGMLSDMRNIVAEEDVDLIVMGTKGASGIKEFFIGSTTEKIVRLIDKPIIAIPGNTKVDDIRKIMVPVALDEIRPSFLRQVSFFQQLFRAAIAFIWVKTPHNIENEDLLNEEFNNLISEYEIASSTFRIVRNVFPQDGIAIAAKEGEADMLAMATHARRGLSHLFSGSLTEEVINHVKLPLWALKIDEEEEPVNLDSYQDIKEISE